LTYQIAGEDPFSSSDQQAVQDAWAQVGIRVGGGTGVRRSASKGSGPDGNLAARIDKIELELKRLSDLLSKKGGK
jgi:hypothetical protein